MALLTPTGEVQFVNRQILEYTGQTLEELKQWGTNGTVHSDDLPEVIQVSHSIIERHQGRLWAEPNEGPGTTFLFSIPRTAQTT